MKTKPYFIPMSGLNFGLCADQGMILPPAFLVSLNLNFQPDGTEKLAKVILASEEPLHFDFFRWSDEQSEEETSKMQKLEKRLEEEPLSDTRRKKVDDELLAIKKKQMNFPVLVEINTDLAEEDFVLLGQYKEEKLPELRGVLRPVPLDKNVRILTPGPNSLKGLKNYLEMIADDFPFEIEIYPKVDTLLTDEQLQGYSVPGEGMNLDRPHRMNAFLGAANLLGEASHRQQWEPGEGHISIGAAQDLIVRSKFGFVPYEKKDSAYDLFLGQDAFREIANDEPARIINHTEAALENLTRSETTLDENEDASEESKESKEEQSEFLDTEGKVKETEKAAPNASTKEKEKDLLEIHDLALNLLAKKCLTESSASIAPFDLLKEVGKILVELAKDRGKDDQQIASKYDKAFSALEDLAAGMGDISQIFSEKSKDYLALRAGVLFAMRPVIKEYLNWPANERPGEASVDDYFTGVLFLGLFHGFCGLGPALKTDWRPFASLALQDEDLPPVKLETSWKAKDENVVGNLTLDYAGCATSIALQANTRSLLLNHLAKLMEKDPRGESLSEDQKKVLGMLAEDSGLDEKYHLQFTDIGEEEFTNHIVSDKLAIPLKRFTHRDWDYSQILEWVKDSPPELPPVSIVPILAKALGYPSAEISGVEPRVDHRTVLKKYIESLQDKLADGEPWNKDEDKLFEILVDDLVNDSQYGLQITALDEKDLSGYLFSGKLAVPVRSFRKKGWDFPTLFELLNTNPYVLLPSKVTSIISKAAEESQASERKT
jgi:hypothetical protein